MNQPLKVIVIQPHPKGYLVQTVGGRAPHVSVIAKDAAEVIKDMETWLALLPKELPPQPETPPSA